MIWGVVTRFCVGASCGHGDPEDESRLSSLLARARWKRSDKAEMLMEKRRCGAVSQALPKLGHKMELSQPVTWLTLIFPSFARLIVAKLQKQVYLEYGRGVQFVSCCRKTFVVHGRNPCVLSSIFDATSSRLAEVPYRPYCSRKFKNSDFYEKESDPRTLSFLHTMCSVSRARGMLTYR